MPTPAVHLALAEEMLRRDDVAAVAGGVLALHVGPFLLGHTAPDVRTVSGQGREESHFYTVPRTSQRPACSILFDRYPSLRCLSRLSPSQAAFTAGYGAHLVLDELWLDGVFQHFLVRDWGAPRERMFLHNVLRTWIDRRTQERLSANVAEALQTAEPDGWLPFIRDEDLRTWRDWLSDQLGSDGKMETAEVLADRMGITPGEINDVVDSPTQMEERVFRHVPRAVLESFVERGYCRSLAWVNWYLDGFGQRPRAAATTDRPLRESRGLRTVEGASV